MSSTKLLSSDGHFEVLKRTKTHDNNMYKKMQKQKNKKIRKKHYTNQKKRKQKYLHFYLCSAPQNRKVSVFSESRMDALRNNKQRCDQLRVA